jgi:phosphotransferase system  glucose/maltose/N-acetylglucosamine-specific IIC component
MRNLKREFLSSNAFCKRREINDESRKKSQIDVFIVVILILRIVFSRNYLVIFVALILLVLVFVVLVFVVVTFSLRTRI